MRIFLNHRLYFITLLALALALCACSDERTGQLNRVSKQVIQAASNGEKTAKDGYESLANFEMPDMPNREDISNASDTLVEEISTATAEKVAGRISEDIKEKADSVEEAYSDTARAVRGTKEAVKRNVRWVARKTPRSEQEANKLVYYYGKEWIDEFRARLNSVARSGALRSDKRVDQRRLKK